jgi:hypothetical protein
MQIVLCDNHPLQKMVPIELSSASPERIAAASPVRL